MNSRNVTPYPASALHEIGSLIETYCTNDGVYQTDFSALSLIRNAHETAPLHSVYEPSICLVAQGEKLVLLGEEQYHYGPSEYFAVSVDLPISGQVIKASPDEPYLAVRLQIDSQQILELMRVMDTVPTAQAQGELERGLFVSQANTEMLDAFVRLLKLMDKPEELPILAPMIAREILYRALQGDQGNALRQMAPGAGRAAYIAEVIQHIRETYSEPLRIDDLASKVSLSPSSLYRHFRHVTMMSPVQFQKQIRLQEARRILLNDSVQAAEVAFQVGYESPSQFNREYVRLFGLPPISDIRRLQAMSPEAVIREV
ncbi:AraC family transcriptional regulator N-terminal domain-containing protein [Paenibacillus sp. WLX2291]|uniref:AraC family transcriptional regulator n=1 Tax=Paenibacillus sp. WLX2291 TaxID=3296934 RepID=UPI003984454E